MPKRISTPRQVVSINLERELVDRLDKDRRDLTRSDRINELCKKGLQYESRGQKKLYEYDWEENFKEYGIRESAQRLIEAMNKGEIKHHNGRMILYSLGLIREQTKPRERTEPKVSKYKSMDEQRNKLPSYQEIVALNSSEWEVESLEV